MCVAKYCSELRELCLEGIDSLVVGDQEVEEHGKWLRLLALRNTGIEKFSHRYNACTTLFNQEDVVFLVERCRESLVSLRVDDYLIREAAHAITNAGNLQDFFGAIFYEDEEYICVQQEECEEYNTVLPLDNGIRAMLIDCAKLERLSVALDPKRLSNVGLGFIGMYGVNLKSLSLATIGGSDEGLMELSKGCPKLRKLLLTYCPSTDQAVKDLWLNIQSLRYIWFENADYTGWALTRPDFDMVAQVPTQLLES